MTSTAYSKHVLNNLWHLFCFLTYPFALSAVVLITILPVVIVTTCIILLFSVLVYCSIWVWVKVFCVYVLYHVYNAYRSLIYGRCVRLYNDLVIFLTRFKAELMLTANLLHTLTLLTSVLLIPGIIGLLISFLLHELTGISVIVWIMGICCLSQKPYEKAHAELKRLFVMCSLYASKEPWCNRKPDFMM